MQSTWTPPLRWVFAAATVLGFFSALQSYRLSTLNLRYPMDIEVGKILLLNLVYWYVPASLTPVIFRLGHRFRVDGPQWIRALGVHVLAARQLLRHPLRLHDRHAAAALGVGRQVAGRGLDVVRAAPVPPEPRLHADDLHDDAGPQLRAALQQGVAGARGQGGAARNAAWSQARLRTLEAELQPHFLFNTLHAISSLVHTNPDGADRMISRLSDLLRLTFDRSGAPRVSLQEELEFLQKYLEIEQTRFHDRLSVRFDIDPDTLDAEVPRLILQPLVENAIKHGVVAEARRGAGADLDAAAGRRISGSKSATTASGLSAGARARLRSGVGLSNTRDRLECLYGTAHRIEFSDDTKGLAVRLEFPFHQAPAPPR